MFSWILDHLVLLMNYFWASRQLPYKLPVYRTYVKTTFYIFRLWLNFCMLGACAETSIVFDTRVVMPCCQRWREYVSGWCCVEERRDTARRHRYRRSTHRLYWHHSSAQGLLDEHYDWTLVATSHASVRGRRHRLAYQFHHCKVKQSFEQFRVVSNSRYWKGLTNKLLPFNVSEIENWSRIRIYIVQKTVEDVFVCQGLGCSA